MTPRLAPRRSERPSGVLALSTAILVATCPLSARGVPCAISGSTVTLHGIRVQPRGSPALTVGLYETSVIAHPSTSSNAPAKLEVNGAIAFHGQRRRLWYTVREPVLMNDGMLELERGARLVDARMSGSMLLASVVLSASARPEGTDIRPELVARPVRVACSELTLDPVFGELQNEQLGDGTWWVPRVSTRNLTLRAAPHPQAPMLILGVSARGGERPLGLERIDQREGWMRLAYASESAVVRGWVRRAEWMLDPDDGATTSDGMADSDVPDYETHYAVPARYEGPARIAVGSVIYAEPGRGPWATVRLSDGFRVRDDGSAWIGLSDIPGVAVEGAQAFVSRTAVDLPPP